MGAYGGFDGDGVTTLAKYDAAAREFLGLSYQAIQRASVFACVIAVMLMGLSLAVSKTEERGLTKAWIMRGVAARRTSPRILPGCRAAIESAIVAPIDQPTSTAPALDSTADSAAPSSSSM